MIKIDHIALWVKDLEASRAFYSSFFGAESNAKYHNPKKNFSSYFLSFPGSEVRLELMHHPDIAELKPADVNPATQYRGLVHFALSVGSRERVNSMTEKIRSTGYKVLSEPRTTGDGYYESVVSDPEGNLIEITI